MAVKLFFSAAHGFSGVAVRARRIAAARRDLGLAVGALARALAGLGLLGLGDLVAHNCAVGDGVALGYGLGDGLLALFLLKVFLASRHPHVLAVVAQTVVDAVLGAGQVVRVGIHLHHRQVAKVARLVDVALVHAEVEVVVDRILRQVVVVGKEDVLLGEVRADLVVFDPEHRVFRLAAEIARTVQHGAYGHDARLHAVGAAVELPFLKDVVVEHLPRGDVGLLDDVFRVALSAPLALLVVDAEAVEHLGDVDLVLVGEDLAAVEIFIGRELAVDNEAEYDAEQVLLAVDHILRIIEGSVLGLGEVELPVNLAHIRQVGVVGLFLGEETLHTVGDAGLRRVLRLLVAVGALADTARILDLCHTGHGDSGRGGKQ